MPLILCPTTFTMLCCCFVVALFFSFLSPLSTHPNRSRQMAAHPEPGSAGGFSH
ncbi:hypothetical protein EXN66_Car010949 [Channa argus]|uniref:Uncharacterized protein n=1 Tax=Channa argus TaxID=215402 RepID=A0A6G1PYK9_CHAAH|nr:hypothetical protein EXN66_Car010949 [Channa argus]